jgi:hypothetical protein
MSDKIEQFWRPATADDVARVMDGQRVEARFRDEESEGWRDGEFLGGYRRYHKLPPRFIDLDGATYLLQVYDPPAWFVNKPDPGEGWRLLEKFPPEEKQDGDEWYDCKNKTWVYASGSKLQRADAWYRRRIATAAPTIKICDPLEIGAMYANADTTKFNMFIDKVQEEGELSFTCSFVWQPLPEPVSVEAGHRIKHPNGCLIEITEDGIKINELIDIKLRKTQS